jgi:hypothetical protein
MSSVDHADSERMRPFYERSGRSIEKRVTVVRLDYVEVTGFDVFHPE